MATPRSVTRVLARPSPEIEHLQALKGAQNGHVTVAEASDGLSFLGGDRDR